MPGGRIDNVVCANNKSHVGVLKIAVDLIHFEEGVIRSIGFGEENVHVPRHPSRDGVNRISDKNPPALQNIHKLLQHVLSLRDGEPIPGHDDHRLSTLEDESGIHRCVADNRSLLRGSNRWIVFGADAREEDVGERAVHRLTHDVGEDDTRRSD